MKLEDLKTQYKRETGKTLRYSSDGADYISWLEKRLLLIYKNN